MYAQHVFGCMTTICPDRHDQLESNHSWPSRTTLLQFKPSEVSNKTITFLWWKE